MWSRSQRPCRRPSASSFDRNDQPVDPIDELAPEDSNEQFEAVPPPQRWTVASLALLVVSVVAVVTFWRGFSVLVLLLPPLVFGTLAWFLYHVFLRKYLRLRRLRNARERHLLREASRR